jgi:RNA polymerase sigma-70 factor (ECF subfamily)
VRDEPSDAVLLARVARGDTAGFETLVARYQDRFYTVARRMLGSPAEAEDAVQRAFLRVLQKAETYRPPWKGSTWLYRVLTNVCVDAWRTRRREALALARWDPPRRDGLPRESSPVEAALLRLPAEARTIVLLRYVNDLPYREIARIRGVTVNTVKSQLRRGKLLLRRALRGGRR